MIRAHDLAYRYPRGDAWVFERHSFEIGAGRVFAILGPNGRGKTTLLKCLAGVVAPTRGRFDVEGALGYCRRASVPPSPTLCATSC